MKSKKKIRDLNHCLKVLSEVSELKLHEIFSQINSVHTSLSNITSFDKANNGCYRISSNQKINEIKFLRKDLKNKSIY